MTKTLAEELYEQRVRCFGGPSTGLGRIAAFFTPERLKQAFPDDYMRRILGFDEEPEAKP
jgi:hypothetical protein